MWTEISSYPMQTYLHIFIKVWARGFHSIMDIFISSIFFFSEEMVTAQWESGFSVPFFWQLRTYVQIQHLQMVSPKKHGSGFCQECPLCLWQYSAILFRFFSLNDNAKQSKKLTGEVELFKHSLAFCPVSILSGPFPGALWSLLNRDSQSLVKEKQWFLPLPFWRFVLLQLTFLKWCVCIFHL